MAYAQEQDLKDRLGEELVTLLADEDGDGAGDSAIIAAALDDASAEIDTILAGRYATPLSPVPALLIRLSVDLAVYFLFIRRRRAIAPEHFERWKQARIQLDAIAEGKMELEGAQGRLRHLKAESSTLEQTKHFDRQSLDSY